MRGHKEGKYEVRRGGKGKGGKGVVLLLDLIGVQTKR